MRKYLRLILCVIGLLTITGCSNKATIIDSDGNESKMTLEELRTMPDAKFRKYYQGIQIEFTGSLFDANENGDCLGAYTHILTLIDNNEKITICLHKYDDISNYDKNDKIHVKGYLFKSAYNGLYILNEEGKLLDADAIS